MTDNRKHSPKLGKRPSDDEALVKLWPKYQAVAARAAPLFRPYDKAAAAVIEAMPAAKRRAGDLAAERTIDRLYRLQDEIYGLRPRTPAGLRIKAQVLVNEGRTNKPDKGPDAFQRGLRTLALDTVTVLSAPVHVSKAVIAAVAAHEKAQAAVDKFCARKVARAGDDKKLAALCDVEIAALWALLDVDPISVADVALILGRLDAFSDAGHILPERAMRKGDPDLSRTFRERTFHDDLVKAGAGWLARLGGVSA